MVERLRNKREQVTSVGVREHGTRKCSKVVRFLYCIPSVISNFLEKRLALKRSKSSDRFLLFLKTNSGFLRKSKIRGRALNRESRFIVRYSKLHKDVPTDFCLGSSESEEG